MANVLRFFHISSIVLFFSMAVYSDEGAALPIDPDVQTMVSTVTQSNCETMLRTLVNFNTRVSTSDGCKKACEWARDQFTSFGMDSVYLDNFSTTHAPNVIGILKGTKKVQDSAYCLTAHIDNMSTTSFSPGADDNGSGCVSVLYAAKAMGKYEFRNDVRFILFSAEEKGLAGSSSYASKHKGEKISIINVDMLLWLRSGDTDYDIEAKTDGKALGNFMVTAAKDYAELTAKVNNPSTCGSDHIPFQQNGFIAIRTLTSLGACEANPHYHQPHDTIGASGNNLPYMTKCVKANLATVALLADPVKTSITNKGILNGERGLMVSSNNNTLTIKMPSNNASGDIEIYNLSGRQIYTTSITENNARNYKINISGIADGIYQIKFRDGSTVFSNKFMISR